MLAEVSLKRCPVTDVWAMHVFQFGELLNKHRLNLLFRQSHCNFDIASVCVLLDEIRRLVRAVRGCRCLWFLQCELHAALLQWPDCVASSRHEILIGGRGEIRTHEPREGSPVFKTGAINRSATLPDQPAAIRSKPPKYERNAAGMVIDPSAFW